MIIILKNVSFGCVRACVCLAVDRPNARNIEKKMTVGQVYTCQMHSRAKHQETQGISTATTQLLGNNRNELR